MAEGWSGGEAVVREESTERFVVAEGTISTDGSFSLTLPVEGEVLADALFTIDSNFFRSGSEPDVTSTIEITPGPFETVFVGNFFSVYDATDGELLGFISLDVTPENPFIYT